MLFQFFREKYRDKVVSAHIVPNLTLLEEAMNMRNMYLKKLGFYVDRNHQEQNRATIRVGKFLCKK